MIVFRSLNGLGDCDPVADPNCVLSTATVTGSDPVPMPDLPVIIPVTSAPYGGPSILSNPGTPIPSSPAASSTPSWATAVPSWVTALANDANSLTQRMLLQPGQTITTSPNGTTTQSWSLPGFTAASIPASFGGISTGTLLLAALGIGLVMFLGGKKR